MQIGPPTDMYTGVNILHTCFCLHARLASGQNYISYPQRPVKQMQPAEHGIDPVDSRPEFAN